ncbi:MAG: hypothetical protein ACI8RZ_003660 [Myxococcota bacterium]|jgi:hypothetical protein
MTPPPPVDFPPSVGGTGLSAIAGLMLGRLGVEAVVHGVTVPMVDWLIVLGVLAFIALLLWTMVLARRKLGATPTASSLRRQWMVVAGGFGIGILIGIFTAL